MTETTIQTVAGAAKRGACYRIADARAYDPRFRDETYLVEVTKRQKSPMYPDRVSVWVRRLDPETGARVGKPERLSLTEFARRVVRATEIERALSA